MSRYLLTLGLMCACTLLAPFRYAWWAVLALAGSRRAWRMAIAEDQAWNVPWGGDEDETISSRAGKAARRGARWGCVLCRLLDHIDPGHCARNIEEDEGK